MKKKHIGALSRAKRCRVIADARALLEDQHPNRVQAGNA
jgi:hypothetical protein